MVKIYSLNIDFGISPIVEKHELENITKLYKEKYPTTTADFWVLECHPDPNEIKKVEFRFYYDTESDLVEKISFISSLMTFQLEFVIRDVESMPFQLLQ